MALQYSPKIVQDGLVLCIDASQNKSIPLADLPVKDGLVMWMDAADDTTFSYSSGSTISQWRDKSSFNYHMVPVSAGPTRNSSINSRKTITITNAQQIGNLSINLQTSANTVFVVSRLTGGANGRVLTAYYNNWLLGHWGGNVNQYYAGDPNGWISYGVYAADTVWRIYMGDWGSNSNDVANAYSNGTLITNQPTSQASEGPKGLGINFQGYEQSNCEAAEIIVFNRLLSATERKLVHTYLGQKWGIANTDRTVADLTNTLTAGMTVGTDIKFQRTTQGAFYIEPITGTIDSGIRYGTSTDKVVNSANSWTVSTTIEKINNTINNWWHLFTDGNSGDILTLDTDGLFKTSMNNTGGNGTFSVGSDISSYGFTWSNLSNGTHELTLVYDQPNSRLQLYIDGIGGGWQTGRTINTGYYLRNFHGWGSANSFFHSDLIWSSLRVYNRLLTDAEILQNYQAIKSKNAVGSYNNPVSSAISLKTAVPNAKSGYYYIKPDGYTGTPVLTFCDLETESGGWMHVGTIYDNNEAYDNATNHPWGAPLNPFQSTGIWEDSSSLNTTVGTPFTTDYKNELWAYAPLSQMLIKYSGANQTNLFYTNKEQLQCTSLASFFAGLNWAAAGSDTSGQAYTNGRVKSLDVTNNGISDPVLDSANRTKILFKFGEYDGAQDANKDRVMIAGHRYNQADSVDNPWGLGCFTNLNGTIHYRDIVPVAQNGNDYPPNAITGAPHAFSIWVKETPNFLGSYNNPATSGKAIKDAYAYATTGWYWLTVDGSVNLYWIDMDYDGGGWVLVANNRLNTGNIGTTAGTYAASTTGFITSGNYGLGTNPSNFNLWVGLNKWNSIAAASGQRKFVEIVSSNIGVKLGQTGFHSKRARWTWTGWNGTYVWQGVGNFSRELGANNPGLYSYHIAGGYSFSTYDLDQDIYPGNCATFYGNTPFWYGSCWDGNLWGGGTGGGYADGPFWSGSDSDYFNYGAYYVK
jgi:hypothetical protein